MNDQKTVVDYAYWLKMDLWTIKEAASLLSSVEPSSDSSSLAIPSKVEKMILTSLAAKKLIADFSSVETNEVSFYPQNIIEWAKFQKGFRITEQLDDFYKESKQSDDYHQRMADCYEYQDIQNQPHAAEKNNETEVYISEALTKLNQAARKFWANADPEDKETHPKNEAVEEWLIEEGLPKTYAPQAATIIRPKWGAKGRR